MKMFLREVCVAPESLGSMTFTNPAADAGDVRIGAVKGGFAIGLLPTPPRPGSPAEFPTFTDFGYGYRVKFPVESVPLVASWGIIQFFTTQPDNPSADERGDSDNGSVTDVRARLHDGTDEYFYTAGAWTVIVDADVDWNTLAEVNEFLSEWGESVLGLVFELSTTDASYTSTVEGFKFTYSVDLVSQYNDWIYGALVGVMQDELRPKHDILVTSDGTASFDFGTVISSALDGWNFVAVTAIFNETTDPAHKTDLLSSYDSGTKIATLTGAPTSGNRLLVRASYEPIIAVTTDQDYFELANAPAVLFERIRVQDIANAPESSSIVNEFVDPPTGIIFPPPRRVNIIVDLVLWASLATTRGRLWESVTQFLNDRPLITSQVTGEKATLQIIDPGFQTDGPPSREGMRDGTMSFRLWDVHLHHRRPLASGDGQPGSSEAYGVSVMQAAVQVGDAQVTVDVEEN